MLKNTLIDYWRKLHERRISGDIHAHSLNKKLWETSGHWDHYRENMYTTEIDEGRVCGKAHELCREVCWYTNPSPDPIGILPLRIGELGLVHRHEKSGQLHGLMRPLLYAG